MGWIKLSRSNCSVFNSSFYQMLLCFAGSKTLIMIVIFISAKLSWPSAVFVILKNAFQKLNKSQTSLISIPGHQPIKNIWDKQRALIKILELEKKRRTKGKKLLWKHSAQTPTEGEAGSLFSKTKADNSGWVKVNVVWIIYKQGWVLVSTNKLSWYIHIQKIEIICLVELCSKPSSLKPYIYRNNIHSSLKTNTQTKNLLLSNPSNLTDHHILSTWPSKIQLENCLLCAFYWLSVLPKHSALSYIIIINYDNFSISVLLPSSNTGGI